MKHGRKQAVYLHTVLEDVLGETHGVMVYQEQVMRILNRLGGIPLAAAYTCIKAISKKKEKLIAENYEAFIAGATERGLTNKQADELWQLIIKFAGYGFNKSHSTAYALIAYQTAYLKAHYPVEFMAALLQGDVPMRNFKRKDQLVEHLEDCQRMGIVVEPPNVNTSEAEFAVAEGRILFGLSAIKGLGSAAEAIVAARKTGGPFVDLFDFCERVDPQACNRAALETLIKAGAWDGLGAHRAQLVAGIDRALQSGASAAADRRSGQMSLFGGMEEEAEAPATKLPTVAPWEEREQLLMEKEVLGFYLTSHPLAEHRGTLETFCSHSTAEVDTVPDRQELMLGGMISSIKFAHVKKVKREGAPTKYANFDLEDMDGVIRCILWPEDFEKYGHLVQPDAILVLRGVLDRRGGDEANVVVNELIPLDQLDALCTRGIILRVDQREHGLGALSTLKEILRYYPGEAEVQLLLRLDDGNEVKVRSDQVRVNINAELRRRVEDLLGGRNIRLLSTATGARNGNNRGGGPRNGRH